MTFRNHKLFAGDFNISHLLAALALLTLFNCNKRSGQEELGDPDTTRITGRNVRKVLAAYAKKHPDNLVIISTPFGDMKAQLYEQTPLHRANFIRLARQGFWDTASFHRVIKDFMVQAGYSDKRKLNLEDYLVPYENDPMRFHKKGALGMAHHDNAPGSSPFDFYIVDGTVLTRDSLNNFSSATGRILFPDHVQTYTTLGGAPHLDSAYTVFGEVIEGLHIIDSIANVPADVKAEKPLRRIPVKVSIVEDGQ
jgi:peptidyl-prolyl cis-trans isomerase B (cyclophilin B)